MDSCVSGSICFEMLKGVPAAFVTLWIGAIAARITYNQLLVARAKLKLDLFEKRRALFQQVWEIVSEVVRHGTRERNYGLATPFNNFRPDIGFLFGSEMEAYIDEMSSNWAELHGLEGERDALGGSDRLKKNERASELRGYFFEQSSHGVKDKFSEYLRFESWK